MSATSVHGLVLASKAMAAERRNPPTYASGAERDKRRTTFLHAANRV